MRETTKTSQIRLYRITKYFGAVLKKMEPNFSDFVFVREDGKPYTSKNLNKIWQEACSKVGIKIKMYNGVRHSLGCQLLDLGNDMDLVREQLGHTKVEMTQRYAKRSKKTLADALEVRRANIINLEQKRNKVGK